MNAIEIISKKRDGLEITSDEIAFFIEGVTNKKISDYQTSAWLMAITIRGMNVKETVALTIAMRDSGRQINLDELGQGSLDKHSTGGVGDKTSLVVVPILASLGVPMLKMSGRGLGFSGGTIDKLESIPGFRTELTLPEAIAQVKQVGAAIIAQSSELAPADKILYALRDVTATVESIPLIASSIMSKKLATGAKNILLDVKVGVGAFMKNQESAEELSKLMVAIGNGAGVHTEAVLSPMQEPLGWCIGNSLEVREAIDVLECLPDDEPLFRKLCLDLSAHALVTVGKCNSLEHGHDIAQESLRSGAAALKFAQIVHAQGGPSDCKLIRELLPKSHHQVELISHQEGIIISINAEEIGRLSSRMGAGRLEKTDIIDHSVGIELHTKVGYSVISGQLLATLHLRANDAPGAEIFKKEILNAFAVDSETLPSQ